MNSQPLEEDDWEELTEEDLRALTQHQLRYAAELYGDEDELDDYVPLGETNGHDRNQQSDNR